MCTSASRLVLGTAQLGMNYGIANSRGMLPEEASQLMVRTALDSGIYHFDTSSNYGCSEEVLGRALRTFDKAKKAKVTSKLDPSIPPADKRRVLQKVEESVDKLGGPLDAFLLHDETILDCWDEDVEASLQAILDHGLARRLGISVYSPRYALLALEKPILSVLQIPGNVLDNRFETSGVLDKAVAKNTLLMVRSIFLQGLLVMDPEEMPERMAYAKPYVARFRAIAKEHGLSPTVAAMSYARQAFPMALILFGALDSKQLLDNIQAVEFSMPSAAYADFRNQLGGIPERVLNPSLWPRGN